MDKLKNPQINVLFEIHIKKEKGVCNNYMEFTIKFRKNFVPPICAYYNT